MKKKKFKSSLRLFIVSAIILLALSFLIGYIWKTSVHSKFFIVKQVVARNSNLSFDYLKGRNIFDIDLNRESRIAASNCPGCKKVRFSRVLPSMIFVDLVNRKPLALVKFYKNFAVDEEGILFVPAATETEDVLPVIYGLETKIFAPKAGTKYKRAELDTAIEIIKEFKASKILRGFVLKRVDVASLEKTGFFILLGRQSVDFTKAVPKIEWVGFEVRVGSGNIKQKIMVLGGLIMQARKELANIKYIDLRFKEPVIKLNNAK